MKSVKPKNIILCYCQNGIVLMPNAAFILELDPWLHVSNHSTRLINILDYTLL